MRSRSIVPLCLLAMLAWSHPAHAGRSYDNCAGFITSVPVIISTPGTWCLKQDIVAGPGATTAISIDVDRVTLDCNDFRLDGTGPGLGVGSVGINAGGRSKVRVRHCNVRGFGTGLQLLNGGSQYTGNVIEHNRFDRNLDYAIKANGNDMTIRQNVIVNIGGPTVPGPAIGIQASGIVDIIGNTIFGVQSVNGTSINGKGINVDSDFGGNIVGNRIGGFSVSSKADVQGIQILGSKRMAVRDNEVIGGGYPTTQSAGVACGSSSGSTLPIRVRDNVIAGFPFGPSSCGDAGENDITP